MIASVQRDGFGDYAHVAFEVVESGVYAVETLAQQSFDGWRGVQKMLKSSFNEHALANTRSVACDVEATADTLTQPNRYFAASTAQVCLPYSGVEKERRCRVALSGLT